MRPGRRLRDDDRGAAAVLLLAVVAATVVFAVGVIALGGGLAGRQRVVAAADQAALAAADAVRGLVTGAPCDRAAELARANETELVDCAVDGAVVTVEVRASIAGVAVAARSTAGPPP
jgi:secretion/DNA translocation related TadE-like protein